MLWCDADGRGRPRFGRNLAFPRPVEKGKKVLIILPHFKVIPLLLGLCHDALVSPVGHLAHAEDAHAGEEAEEAAF